MVASQEWTEWHLTPKGWVEGSSRIDLQNPTNVEPPSDRVLTYKYTEVLRSGYSEMEKSVERIWTSGNEVEITRLIEQYGQCPRQL